MSSASGVALGKDGGVLGYFKYHGTSDTVGRYKLTPDVNSAWEDTPDIWGEGCSHEGEPAILVTCYGSCFYWRGEVCRDCLVITKGFMPWDDDDSHRHDGVPSNAPAEIQEWLPQRG